LQVFFCGAAVSFDHYIAIIFFTIVWHLFSKVFFSKKAKKNQQLTWGFVQAGQTEEQWAGFSLLNFSSGMTSNTEQ